MNGKDLVRLPYKELDTPFPFMLLLPQFETERILEERLVALGGAVERGVCFAGLEPRQDGVEVILEHGNGEEERAKFAYVVGCDGARSAVREAMGVSFEGAQYDETFVLGDVTLSLCLPRNEAYAFASPRGVVAVLPMPDGRFRVLGPAAGMLPPGPAGPLAFDVFRDIIDKLGALGGATMTDPLRVARFNVHRRIAGRYVDGRVILAGDAAHIHSPAGGQGMNLGIQDAANVAWKLAAVVRRGAPDTLIETYEHERRPVALATIQGTDSATRLAMLKNIVAVAVRDRVVPFLLGRVLARRTLLGASQLGTAYPSSSIAVDKGAFRAMFLRPLFALLAFFVASFGGGRRLRLRAGGRAPDAASLSSERGTTRLFPVFAKDGRSTVLAFAGRAPSPDILRRTAATLAEAEADNGPVVVRWILPEHGNLELALGPRAVSVRDPGLDAHARYGAEGGGLFLVRPDGYLGFVGSLSDADALTAHVRHTLAGPTRPRGHLRALPGARPKEAA
jgi:2-polyprenyl-6-methoxyphenol hydroxylase-like FAD-dependent oxidoreductase